MENKKSIAIIGIGNFLMCDEGAGIHAIAELEKHEWASDIELIDAGTPGVSLIYMIENRDLVIIIDCADFSGKPGEIGVFDPADLKPDENDQISLHATDLLGSLTLAKKTGNYPKKIRIVGIQPTTIEMGTKLSEPVQLAINDIQQTIAQLLTTL